MAATVPPPNSSHSALRRYVAADALHLILMPTERCNFRCTYCYEDFAHGRMRPPTVQGIRRLLASRAPGLRLLALEWFGGEPLLALPVVEEIQEHAQGLAARHPSLTLRGSMTTNGYRLTPEVLGRLVGLGVRSYQVSVDGDAPAHDARRRRADGSGSFERIWANLVAAREGTLDFRIMVRVHVDRENRAGLTAFLEELAAEFAADERFSVFLRPLARLGGAADSALPILRDDEEGAVDELRRLAASLGLRVASPGGPVCYASAANSFVIRSTGEIAKCTVALRHANNRLGRLHPDGTVTVDDEKINGWVRGLFSGDAEELGCPMVGFAQGGGDDSLAVVPERSRGTTAGTAFA